LNCKKILFSFFIFIFLIVYTYSQEEEIPDRSSYSYDIGDNMFTIKAGLFFPLFFMSPEFNTASTNLSLGGVGSLEWGTFISNNISLGVEFGGMFAFSPNDRIFYMLPLTLKGAYYFRIYPFEFLLHTGAGISFNTVGDAFHIDIILKPGITALWNFNEEWAFGLNFIYWWVPQLYTGGGDVPKEHTRFGNFLETSLSALFRF
jgi:hypothetical protein